MYVPQFRKGNVLLKQCLLSLVVGINQKNLKTKTHVGSEAHVKNP